MVFFDLAKKKEILRCALSIKALIIEGKWQEVKIGLEKLTSLYHLLKTSVKIDNSCLQWPDVVRNLSNILILSLVYNSPYGIVEKILKIDPEISSILVLIPYSPDAERSLRNGGNFLCWRRRYCAALPNPPDTSDIVNMVPVQIACKKGTRADIIRCLLLYDKDKITYRCKAGFNERNLLCYATICALCRYHCNPKTEPVLLGFEDTGITSPTYADSQQSQSTEGNNNLTSESPPNKKISFLPSCAFFQEHVNLIKFLCMKSPMLLMLRDSDNYSALEIVRIVRSKIKENRKHKSLFLNKEDKRYCKRVEYIYKILKRAYQRYRCGLASSKEDNDLQTECAQCEGSTGWTLNEFFEDCELSSTPERTLL